MIQPVRIPIKVKLNYADLLDYSSRRLSYGEACVQ